MTADESVLALGRTSLTCQKHIGQAARCDARCCLLSVRFPLLLMDTCSVGLTEGGDKLQPIVRSPLRRLHSLGSIYYVKGHGSCEGKHEY